MEKLKESFKKERADWDSAYARLDTLSNALLVLVKHIRDTVPRVHWCPEGAFRQFLSTYSHAQPHLEVSLQRFPVHAMLLIAGLFVASTQR